MFKTDFFMILSFHKGFVRRECNHIKRHLIGSLNIWQRQNKRFCRILNNVGLA